ncbi:MAG: hypothetical protein JWQ11_3989 [Rhizobacter sp.]|nr:hypothetical protein [Rhizobacter sp.]
MSDHPFTPEAIAAIAQEIRAKHYQSSPQAKAELFEKIYPEPENRLLVSDDPMKPIVVASALIGDDEGTDLMEICLDAIPPNLKPIDCFVLAGLVQFEGEDAMPFAHLIADTEIADRAAAGKEMKTLVTVTYDGIEDTSDELAENPFVVD